ncbi:hypothetical protein E4T47_01607 [Aureobasidium subglaciale]|nr:hypothetical protein E4T47_01607 [Aureobasidium subglaciale]
MYADPPRSMERVSRRDIFTSLPARIQWLHSFLEFGTDDVQALISGQKYIKAVIPAIVNIVYKKLLKYDITARVFTTRNSRDEGPVESWPTEDSAQIEHRKMEYLDKVGKEDIDLHLCDSLMHVGKGRQNPLHVDYVFLGACLGFIQDSLFEAEIQEDEREGYLHGKKILGDDGSSILTSRTGSSRSSDSGKTSLGRPIEEATHLSDGMSRCPFSGMSRTGPNPAELERQRATSAPRSPRVNGTAPEVLQQYHNPGTPRVRLIDGKTVLKENLEPNPFQARNPTFVQARKN